MPLVSLRGLGQAGLVTDLPAVDLPLPALTTARNVVFRDGAIRRSPLFRRALHTGSMPAAPQGFGTITPAAGFDRLIVVSQGGGYVTIDNGHVIDANPDHYDPASAPVSSAAVSFASHGGTCVINRAVEVPYYLDAGSQRLQPLPGWDDNWRCAALRSYKDFLVAVDIAKGGARFANTVKWSDIVDLSRGPVPQTWAETVVTYNEVTKLNESRATSAGENTLAGLASPLVDAVVLKDALILYAVGETWVMSYVGGNDIFRFDPLFERRGALNTNAAMGLDGRHYVFGDQDLWSHDGVSAQSVISGRIRNRVYRHLDPRKRDRVFVTTDRARRLVYFCYPSTEAGLKFAANRGCNVAVALQPDTGAVAEIDLPDVVAGQPANVNWAPTYDSETGTYDTDPLDYADKGDTFDKPQVFLTAATLLVMDEAGEAAMLPGLETSADDNGAPLVARTGLSLADMAGLDAYKVWREINPLIELEDQADAVVFRFGAAPWVSSPTAWGPEMTFRPAQHRHLNSRVGGRMLAYEFRPSDPLRPFCFSGFDFDPQPLGRRG